ncbi:hypothetical protein [Ollibium composti]|uniref:Uncharacterized protein n=1 Tax=Ollibium composti TaxID=2675109 RepID=A0ABY2Q9E6_9HYPH|nr:hypothetical protein [Mesorhizobium composti]THF58150.1 hypothetical protein E6C48_05895 [Mesorhizobium composti]
MLRPRKRGSKIGFIVDPFRRRQVWYESILEESVLAVLLALPETLWVHEQQHVAFVRDGQQRHHYFDFVQRQARGRIAYAVKYEQDVDDDLLETLRLVCEQVGDRFADEYLIITEKDLTRTQIENAGDILACASDFDFAVQAAVEAVLSELPSQVRLDEIVRATGQGDRARRAALTLIQKGILKVPPNVRLGDDVVLVNRAAGDGAR